MFRFRRIWSSFFETRINPAEQYFCCLTPYPIELALKNKIPCVLKGCVLFMNRFFTQCIFISFVVTMFSVEVCAQTVIPPVGEAGIIEKLLRQSRPEFQPPPEDNPPQIIIEDSRTVKDPGAGPSFFVKKIVVEHLDVEAEKVTEKASFIDDLGADSLDNVELGMAFEEVFDIEIPDDAAEHIQTVGDAVKFISEKLG